MSMAEDFKSHREFVRGRKDGRAAKFREAFSFIESDAASIGWVLLSEGDAWEFLHAHATLVKWWPASGKTHHGEHFGTWPDLKAHLVALAKEAE